MTLASLKNKEEATIIYCPIKKLCEMGIVPGASIRMKRAGITCMISLHNTILGLGMGYQKIIDVERKNLYHGNNQNRMSSM